MMLEFGVLLLFFERELWRTKVEIDPMCVCCVLWRAGRDKESIGRLSLVRLNGARPQPSRLARALSSLPSRHPAIGSPAAGPALLFFSLLCVVRDMAARSAAPEPFGRAADTRRCPSESFRHRPLDRRRLNAC